MILFPSNLVAVRTPASLVKGVYTDGTPVNVPFVGEIQPMTARDVAALNVGRAELGKVLVMSEIELLTTTDGGPSRGDVVTFNGKKYELIQAEPWNHGVVEHFEYIGELRS